MTRTRKPTNKTISIEDVARLAGVSVTTVSRVINKFPSVKDNNRLKVEDAVKRLKFTPSLLAQRLATGRTNVIALVMPRYEGLFYSFYALELIRSIGNMCDVLKLDLLLHITDGRSPLSVRDVGGIIFNDVISNRKQLEQAFEAKLPCVVINNRVDDLEVNCISIDNTNGAMEAVEYLINLGHKNIAHITGDLVTQAAEQRLEGYKKALKKHNIPLKEEYIIKTDYSRGKARMAAETFLKLPQTPSAIFIASDSMALEVMGYAIENGKNIPKDISIVGFDDNPSGLYGPVSLTTVRQPLIKMGEEAVRRLNEIMHGEDTSIKKVALPTELVIRDSCQKIS